MHSVSWWYGLDGTFGSLPRWLALHGISDGDVLDDESAFTTILHSDGV
jgi:hypothetical protein